MGNSYPETRRHMLRASYKLLNTSKCKRCGAAIEWWQTTNGSRICFDLNPNAHETAVVHLKTCSPQPAQATPDAPAANPRKRLEEELCRLLDRTRAKVIVLIEDNGDVFAYRANLNAEDIRMDIISAANHVRNEIQAKENNRAS